MCSPLEASGFQRAERVTPVPTSQRFVRVQGADPRARGGRSHSAIQGPHRDSAPLAGKAPREGRSVPSPGPAPPTVLTWARRSRGCRVWVWAWRGYPSGLRHGLSIGGLTCPVSLPRAQWLCHSGPCSRRVFEAPFPAAWGPWVGGRASGRPRAVGRRGGPSQPTVPQAAGPAHPFPTVWC